MVARHRYHCGLLIAAGWLCVAAAPSFSQPSAPEAEGLPPVAMHVSPTRETVQVLQHARESLKQNRLADALPLLQRLIEMPEDYFLDRTLGRTLKSETLAILAEMSREHQQDYERLQGTQAKALLDEALAASNFADLADIVRRFPRTSASRDAAELLAARAMDLGRPWRAAEEFSRLRTLEPVTADRARQLMLREALARHHAGQTDRAAELLREVTAQHPGLRVEVAGQPLPAFSDVKHAKNWLKQLGGTSATTISSGDWLNVRGNADGSSSVSFTAPVGGPVWQVNPLVVTEGKPSAEEILPRLYRESKDLQDDAERLTWPTTTPIVVRDQIIFRTVRDVAALDRRTGAVRWRSVLSDPALEQLLAKAQHAEAVEDHESELVSYLRERLFEDRTFGSLSSDGRLVFAIEGQELVAATARVNQFNNRAFVAPPREEEPETMNRLVAYDAQGGRLAWEIGGPRLEAEGDFADHFFLGPPASEDDRLFVLAEVQGEIRLLMLEASPAGVKKLWSQPLVAPTLKITDAVSRRRQTFIPAVSNGLVICPTGAGTMVAVDPTSQRLVWAYQYQSTDQAAMFAAAARGGGMMFGVEPGLANDESDAGWQDGNPVVVDGRVFVTPTDSDELHCVNLSDGVRQWSIPRDRAVALAGADAHRAVLIGPDRLDAIEVATGRPAWNEPLMIPPPTGRGVWMDDRYSLPLSTGEIATVDLQEGRILARSKIPDGRLPGNLAAGSGALISVSPDAVMAFRSDTDVEQEITRDLAANAQDAAALASRGERRLHRGEFDAGLADLRASIAADPQPYVKSVLAAALLEGLRTDFDRYRDALAELETLTDDPQQRSEFLWLAARGLKDGGDRVAAFERMTHLVDQSLDAFSSMETGSPWQSRNDRRLTAYFADLYRQATETERQQLDAEISRRLPASDSLTDDERIAALRRFLRAFGFHAAANVARQQLVAKLDPDANDLELVQELTTLAEQPDALVAAPAAAKLAAWFLSRKRIDDVNSWLTELDDRFSTAECEPGVTGRAFAGRMRDSAEFQELQNRFVPWQEGEIDKEYIEQPPQGGRMSRVQIVEPVPATYLGWSFETDQQGQILVARDQQGLQRWMLNRNPNDRAASAMFRDSQSALHRVHLCGHLVGWATGSEFLIAADVESDRSSPRILWQETLTAPGTPTGGGNRWVMLQQWQRLQRRRGIVNQPFLYNLPQAGGALVALTDSAVIYHNGRKLMAADPLTGKLQWSRRDLSASLFEAHADDTAVALLDRTGDFTAEKGNRESSLTLLRTMDGQRLAKTEPPSGVVEWIGGSRALRWEAASNSISMGLFDVLKRQPIWETKLSRPAAIQTLNQSEVFVIEENRRLTVRNFADGAIRWSQNLTLPVPVETLIVQRWQDRYLVIAGSSSPEQGAVRALGFSSDHQPIAGMVAALNRDTGDVIWETPINDPATDPTAFDVHQPAGWPVLLFAGQLWVPPPPGAVAQPARRLTVTFIDKRTGKREYFTEQTSAVSLYFVDLDTERNRLTANFMNWALNLHYTGKTRK